MISLYTSNKGGKEMWIRNVMTLVIIFLIPHFSFLPCQADNRQARKLIRQGNSQYRNNKHHDAQISYFKAVNADSTDARALYNLATSMFPEPWKMVKKEQVDTMTQTLMKAAELEQNPFRKAQAYHNTGVLYQNAKDFKLAIEAYKEALRNNPNDDETRYNLVLCQRQLKNEGQDGGSGQDNQQDDKQKQEQKEQQKQDQQQQQQKQEQQEQQQKQQEPPMSKENAEQLLNAAMQQEKKTQERMQQQLQQGQRRKLEKNW